MKAKTARTPSRYRKTRNALLFWCLFIGIGALGGGVCMLLKPDGSLLQMGAMLPYFQVLPFADILFRDYVFSGIALLCVNCIPNLIAAFLMFRKKESGHICGGIFGVTLMLWICIQFYMFPANPLSISYFIFGLIQAVTGYMAFVFYRQEQFTVKETDYPAIGTNPKEAVVFFSRMGYTKKAAYEEANRLGAVLYEVKSTEKTGGSCGFWWCGRYAMHQWEMPIVPIGVDLSAYDHVTLCSPIWVFALSAPMRAFCRQASGKIKSVSYILVHHQKQPYENAAEEMDRLLGCTRQKTVSICCRLGKILSKAER